MEGEGCGLGVKLGDVNYKDNELDVVDRGTQFEGFQMQEEV